MMKELTRPLGKPLVPQQPAIHDSLNDYASKVQVWNSVSKKNAAHFYQFATGPHITTLQLIPDNCVDFLFQCGSNPSSLLLGPRLRKATLMLEPNTTYFFFKPYSLTSVKPVKVPFTDLIDGTLPFEKQFDDVSIIEKISVAGSFTERIDLLLQYANKFLIDKNYDSSLVEYLELCICATKGSATVERVVSSTGYSNRHCRNQFKNIHGISIKNYTDIIRLQNIVRMLSRSASGSVNDIVYENKLYDQSHLIHELKKYTGYTPDHFVKHFYPQR